MVVDNDQKTSTLYKDVALYLKDQTISIEHSLRSPEVIRLIRIYIAIAGWWNLILSELSSNIRHDLFRQKTFGSLLFINQKHWAN